MTRERIVDNTERLLRDDAIHSLRLLRKAMEERGAGNSREVMQLVRMVVQLQAMPVHTIDKTKGRE